MGEILGVGISHSPLFGMPPDKMSGALRARLNDPKLPATLKDQANWPEKMRAEWSNDFGAAAGAQHQADMLADFRKVRAALDEFAPDFIVIWGDDQYENFREQIIPPFCILAYDEVVGKPWASAPDSRRGFRANVWNEGPDAEIHVKCHREAAKYIASALIEQEFDMSYAYEPRFHKGLAHAFLNAVMYLDYERKGFPHRIVPIAVNCYGREVISAQGLYAISESEPAPPDPPAPSPHRCFTLGAAIARICRDSPWRVVLMASSAWSHSFLTPKTHRLVPDVETDRRLYQAMVSGEYSFWKNFSLKELEAAGGGETLNWFGLVGAMAELGQKVAWSSCLETYVFNATKVSVIFQPA
jgi:hypothetical protein